MKKKKRETNKRKKRRRKKPALEAAGCCGQALRGLRVAASLGSTKSDSSPRCAGGAGRGGQNLENKTEGSGGRGQEPSGGCRAQGSARRWGSAGKDSTGLRMVPPGGWHAAMGRRGGCAGAPGLCFELVLVLSIILCPDISVACVPRFPLQVMEPMPPCPRAHARVERRKLLLPLRPHPGQSRAGGEAQSKLGTTSTVLGTKQWLYHGHWESWEGSFFFKQKGLGGLFFLFFCVGLLFPLLTKNVNETETVPRKRI